MSDERLFDRPAVEWSDAELSVGMAQIGARVDELKAMTGRLVELAAVLADERDRRHVMYRQVAEVVDPTPVARVLRSPSERRRGRRGRRA